MISDYLLSLVIYFLRLMSVLAGFDFVLRFFTFLLRLVFDCDFP